MIFIISYLNYRSGRLVIYYLNIISTIITYLQMGSFRSQPDLVKHSLFKTGEKLNYAVSHMCGIFLVI